MPNEAAQQGTSQSRRANFAIENLVDDSVPQRLEPMHRGRHRVEQSIEQAFLQGRLAATF